MTNNDKLQKLLNDAEINLLADLFLSFIGADMGTPAYRSLRSALILTSNSIKPDETFSALGGIENREETDIRKDVCSLLINADTAFNATFKRNRKSIVMPHYKDPIDALLFLGTTFLYIIKSGYNV